MSVVVCLCVAIHIPVPPPVTTATMPSTRNRPDVSISYVALYVRDMMSLVIIFSQNTNRVFCYSSHVFFIL